MWKCAGVAWPRPFAAMLSVHACVCFLSHISQLLSLPDSLQSPFFYICDIKFSVPIGTPSNVIPTAGGESINARASDNNMGNGP